MKARSIHKYCGKVKRHLLCDKRTRQELVDGLLQELLERDFSSDLTYEQLCAELGSPLDMARQLLESVPLEQQEKAARQSKNKRWIIIAICLLIVALVIGVLIEAIHQSEENVTYRVVEEIEESPNY